jgi:peroxiredoxin
LISDLEFVDIRMANFHIPDRSIVKTLEDGSTEFRLQKVPQEGAPLPPLELRTLDGKILTAQDLAGKVLVVNFWFVGCPACVYETPRLNELAAKFAGRDDVLFVSMTADPTSRVRKYLEKEKFDYVHVADAGPQMRSIGFGGYPKNFVVGRDGRIVYWRSTVRAWWKFEAVIREELAK